MLHVVHIIFHYIFYSHTTFFDHICTLFCVCVCVCVCMCVYVYVCMYSCLSSNALCVSLCMLEYNLTSLPDDGMVVPK